MKFLLIDGLNVIRRIHAAIPHDNEPENSRTHIDGTIDSSTASLRRALNHHQPTHCVAVFEGKPPSWRHRLFADYKKDRKPIPQPLSQSLPEFIVAFSEIGINSFSLDGFEADDVLATLACKTALGSGNAVILSTDRLLCQLLKDRIQVYDHFAQNYLDQSAVQRKYHVPSHQIPEVLALAGDSGLSIPGVQSIGIKTAAKLITEYGGLENVLDQADTIPGKMGEYVKRDSHLARQAHILFQLKTDIELGINLNQLRLKE